MSKSLLSAVAVVPFWAFWHAVPVPGHVRTVLPAVTTWPRSVVLKRGANVRSAKAVGASAPQTTRAPTTRTQSSLVVSPGHHHRLAYVVASRWIVMSRRRPDPTRRRGVAAPADHFPAAPLR